jgi:CTP:molybdopterin cytidylyltransferase MocA
VADDAEGIVALLLAAGRSDRFGAADKLSAPLRGRPLAYHAAENLAATGCARRLAVVREGSALDFRPFGFEHVLVAPGAPISLSLQTGARAAGDAALLVALADMPLLPTAHFQRLLARHEGDVTATSRMGKPMVPAIFGIGMRERLWALTGDKGAQSLLAGAALVEALPAWLMDIDTVDDLARVEAGMRAD